MSHTNQVETMAVVEASAAICDDLTEARDALARAVLDRTVGKWPMWVMSVLAADAAPVRFSRIAERVEGVSQKMLTQTLRQLERDGLITRKVYPQVPPRVEYALTSLGHELLRQVMPVWDWIVGNIARFETARAAYAQHAGEAGGSL